MDTMEAVTNQIEQSEKALRESEERFRSLYENSTVGLYRTTPDGKILLANPSLVKMLGFSSFSELAQRNLEEEGFEPGYERAQFQHRLATEGEVKGLEASWTRRDGTAIFVRESAKAIRDAEGKIAYYEGTVEDITERKRAEEALKKSEEKFSKAFRNSPVVVSISSVKDYRYLDVSESFEQWTGWHRDEVIGRTPLDIEIWANPAERLEMVKRLLAEGVVRNIEVRYRRKDGVEKVALGSAELIEIGNEQCVISALADINELKRTQEALRVSEERLRMGQWAARIGTFDLNLRTGEDIWTPETEALYGLPPGGFGGTLSAFENLIHPDDRERVVGLLSEELKRTGTPVESEWRTVWPDGSVHWIAGRGQVIRDESGKPSRMLGVNMDITDRKRAEEALSSMTRTLVEAQELERSRIGRELHDDINQRLAILSIALGQLRDKNNLTAEVRNNIQELKEMASELTTDIHAMSHELHSSTLEYLGIVTGMKSWCEEYGKRHNLEIDFKSHDVPKLPQEISLCLFRVLQEALHNATKYSGVRQLQVQLAEKSGEIHLTVSDSGKGFDVEAARLKGGLGLTSMQERVRLVGGTILIDSKPLAGTTIHVTVPFTAERSSHAAVG